MITEEVGEAAGVEGLGGLLAGAGLVFTAIGAVCCGLIVALPLLMNGNDLDDE
jgi:ABC-type molybdate transport system permease subunit